MRSESRSQRKPIHRVSPQKARLVVDLIRGQQRRRARSTFCAHQQAHRADRAKRFCDSAIANAENRHNDVDVDELS